ncbi:hypothetical protein O181_044611 [Austropuccinia psidii MF-1]|uniref:Uncharacterized protein n=1 Tax=Austropuccinia psidii MF-1 TaxID=1389203 RepID=A0A9Q3HH10_9BASI|nr:hypothetical protein [Austropuccinia psidii MF-1]
MHQGLLVSRSTRNRHWSKQSQIENKISLDLSNLIVDNISDNESIASPSTTEASALHSPHKKNSSDLIQMILGFMAWLYLSVGVSRERCHIAREFLVKIIGLLQANNYNSAIDKEIPKDIRTIVKQLNVTPEIHKHVCCPLCYSVYDFETSPFDCGYQEFPHSTPCGESLFPPLYIKPFPCMTKQSQHLQHPPKPLKDCIPFSMYITQNFVNCLKWFIPQMEDSIDDWRQEVQAETNSISDYQHSNAWKSLYPPFQTSQESLMALSFSLFVDWFNPLTNKLAGRQVSLGVLALNCLNLPPAKRWKLQNTFISGIIPAPNQPDMITINDILSVFVDEINPLSTGINISTPKYPNSQKVIIKLGCWIGDLVATHKVAGYASHSAKFFCTWCDCVKDNIEKLEVGHLRQARTVRDYSHAFKQARNQAERERILKKAGVRWSELNRLPYWDPVQHVSLGLMHMWYEGVLKNHFVNRWQWSFEQSSEKKQDNDLDENNTTEINDGMSTDSQSKKIQGLSNVQVNKFKSLFQDVIVRTGVTRIPSQIGTAKAGKIKASEWKSLFSIYLPLVVLDVFLGDFDSIESTLPSNWLLLKNVCTLVMCTNILISQSINESDGNSFLHQYKTYCKTSEVLFSHCTIKPNHHYALHVKAQLSWWGPLCAISENSGEQLNGFLQKLKNNGKSEKFGLTLMNRFCQWQRLEEKNFLTKNVPQPAAPPVNFTLDRETYLQILSYLKKTDASIRDHLKIPHPEGAKILLNYAKEITALSCGNRPNSFNITNKPPNNIIKYKTESGHERYGLVQHILKVLWEPQKDTFLLIKGLKKIEHTSTSHKTLLSIFRSLSINQLTTTGHLDLIQSSQVCGLCAYRHLPAWSLGIKQPTMLVRLIKESHYSLVDEKATIF